MLPLLTTYQRYCPIFVCVISESNSVLHLLTFQGKVTVAAKSGVKLEIPDGAVIANKVNIVDLNY